LSSW
jgi:predicted dienelactone hydrolase